MIEKDVVEVFDLISKEWSYCTSLNEARNFHVSCVLGQFLYIAGGDGINTIEKASCEDLI